MPTSRSDSVHAGLRESTEKFDYFILGVVGALCAYISQTYKAERIGINPGTLELLALLMLVLAAVFGFRRIEATLLSTAINHRILHSNERRGVLASVARSGPGFNSETGQTYTPEYAAEEIPRINEQLRQLQPKLIATQNKALRYYKLRNALTLAGFLMLLAAKVFSAYV